mmetsp:Transcript_44441/g.62360  ORF Transcript_44441/g.62360 Transcript_44441/m.62360 type:complete len:218 (-) Transcript_44441:236-889(-)
MRGNGKETEEEIGKEVEKGRETDIERGRETGEIEEIETEETEIEETETEGTGTEGTETEEIEEEREIERETENASLLQDDLQSHLPTVLRHLHPEIPQEILLEMNLNLPHEMNLNLLVIDLPLNLLHEMNLNLPAEIVHPPNHPDLHHLDPQGITILLQMIHLVNIILIGPQERIHLIDLLMMRLHALLMIVLQDILRMKIEHDICVCVLCFAPQKK